MVTTIQLNEHVRDALDRLKQDKESYERVILKLIEISEIQRRKQENLLIEGYKEMAEESMKITKEFEAIEEINDSGW